MAPSVRRQPRRQAPLHLPRPCRLATPPLPALPTVAPQPAPSPRLGLTAHADLAVIHLDAAREEEMAHKRRVPNHRQIIHQQ